ncbi:MAG TPA: hypothetical protein VGG03_03235 [Thermoanaerobaculia bacterium]|jgi:hypothetical protein
MARKMLLLAVAITLTSWASVQADPPPPCDCYLCFASPSQICDAGGTVVCADWWPPNCNYW